MTATASGATSPVLRRLTSRQVLDALLATERVTASDLMAVTGLSRPTVHAVCDELIGAGWVVEHEGATRGTGRPARTYELNSTAAYVVGIDMGVLKVRAVVADLRGRTVAEHVVELRDWYVGGPERVDVVRTCVAALLDEAGVAPASVLAAAMGVPASVHDGRVLASPGYLPGLADLDLRTALQDSVDVPLLVDNDANLAVVGERWRGAARGVDDVVVVLAGERLGAGLMLGGRLLRGRRGAAGELAFLRLVEGVGNTDGIGNLARNLGAYAAAELRSAPAGGPPLPGGLLERSGTAAQELTAEDVVAAARHGDPAATDVLDVIAERMARVVTVVSSLLDPELVVVGGAVADADDVLLPRLEAQLGDAMPAPPRLAMSTLGDHAVVAGAVRLGLDDVLRQLHAAPRGARTARRPAPASPGV